MKVINKYESNNIYKIDRKRNCRSRCDYFRGKKPLSKLIFKPQIHNNGIRGFLVRQKRSNKNEDWKDEQSIKLKDLADVDGVNFEIPSEGVKNLFIGIKKLATILRQNGVEYGENHYAVVDPNSVIITDENKVQYIKKILEAGYEEETWENIVELNPDLATKLSYARIHVERKRVLEELQERLKKIIRKQKEMIRGKIGFQKIIGFLV